MPSFEDNGAITHLKSFPPLVREVLILSLKEDLVIFLFIIVQRAEVTDLRVEGDFPFCSQQRGAVPQAFKQLC